MSGEVKDREIELIGDYGPFAAQLARELGVVDRTSFRVHDLLEDPGTAQPADVVLMNKVVCCSGEGLEAAAASAGLAKIASGLSGVWEHSTFERTGGAS